MSEVPLAMCREEHAAVGRWSSSPRGIHGDVEDLSGKQGSADARERLANEDLAFIFMREHVASKCATRSGPEWD